MSPETETNLALLFAALAWLQAEDADVPPPGQVTPEYLSALSRELGTPVSATTIRREESLALAKAAFNARQLGLPYFLKTEN